MFLCWIKPAPHVVHIHVGSILQDWVLFAMICNSELKINRSGFIQEYFLVIEKHHFLHCPLTFHGEILETRNPSETPGHPAGASSAAAAARPDVHLRAAVGAALCWSRAARGMNFCSIPACFSVQHHLSYQLGQGLSAPVLGCTTTKS